MNETDFLPSSLYALVTSFNSVIYSTFASQSNVLFSVGLRQQNYIPIGLHCVDNSKNLQCRFTFLLNSCTKLKCFPELNVCNVCEQAKTCIMLSEVECIAGDEMAVRSQQLRLIWCPCRLICVLYSSGLFLERICHTG